MLWTVVINQTDTTPALTDLQTSEGDDIQPVILQTVVSVIWPKAHPNASV